jgi:hypothetical protein
MAIPWHDLNTRGSNDRVKKVKIIIYNFHKKTTPNRLIKFILLKPMYFNDNSVYLELNVLFI